MIPLKQRHRHDPANGIWGDCHRACVASILELPLDAVPNFHEPPPGEAWRSEWAAIRERVFLISCGFVPITCCYHEDMGLEQVLAGAAYYNPGTYWILGGTSRNGTGHSVVCLDDLIVHDPSLDDSGIVGPMEGGHYWATFIGAGIALKATRTAVSLAA